MLTMEQFGQSGSVVDFQIYYCNCDVHILHQHLLDYKGHNGLIMGEKDIFEEENY